MWKIGVTSASVVGRGIDVVIASLALIVCSPLLAFAFLGGCMKAGPLLQRDRRLGRYGSEFDLISFDRSILPTRMSRLRYAPTLLNVLLGDMSMIGPRPLHPHELSLRDRAVRKRSMVRPGLISLWWVRKKANIDYLPELTVDLEYVDRRSSSGDLGIALRSIPALLTGVEQAEAPQVVDVLGVPVCNVTMDDAIDVVVQAATQHPLKQICFVNTDCVNRAQRDRAYAELLRNCDAVFADGIGIRIAGSILRQRIRQNVNGTDLLPLLCKRLEGTSIGLFLLGARPGIAEAMARWIESEYPGMRVNGMHDGYFLPSEEESVIREINESQAEIVLVAFGAPRQDMWIAQHRDKLHAGVAMGVGGLFDFYSGQMPRAPQWLRELSLEWTFRLYKEPGRMWKRYLVGNLVFLSRICITALVQRSVNIGHLHKRGH
jgi:N-acetylglucosaminyldiphosphoundecaprenol N-acetyl-beta-D-mannosaminyltransferase